MSDELLPYYNRELSYLRHLGAQFAADHPKIAGRLRLGAHTSEDPHVERLIEAFAYLSARIRYKLEDDFPEITDAMLGVLYPHYQAPIPSMAIVQFVLDPEQVKLTHGYTIPRESMIETEPVSGGTCFFRTCYPVTLWPIDLVHASLTPRPFTAPTAATTSRAAALLHLVLRCRDKTMGFADLDLDRLRFYLGGQDQHAFALYELLFNHAVEVALASSADDPQPRLLGKQALEPVGFARDEGMLPYSARSFLGYRLLSEFFAFPRKFLFFDLVFNRSMLQQVGNTLEIFVYLKQTSDDLEHNLSATHFCLGCAPIINLYRRRAEPIRLTQTEPEYRVVPDARRPLASEIYSIDRVTATSPDGDDLEFMPFYSVKHARPTEVQQSYWSASRRPSEYTGRRRDHGTEVYLSLVNPGFKASAPMTWTLDVETTCLNRDLPYRLPFGGGKPRLQLAKGGAPLARIICLTAPTRTLRPALKRGAMWRLISHLTLNHLSLEDHVEGADGLREILMLYDCVDTDETRSMINGILGVASRRVVGRAGSIPGAFCRGVEVTIHFDEDRFAGSGLFLFACVLERFLGLYCSVNSFTKLIATTHGQKRELRRWPPRMGDKVLL